MGRACRSDQSQGLVHVGGAHVFGRAELGAQALSRGRARLLVEVAQCLADPGEVVEWRWMTADELARDVAARPEIYTVWFRKYCSQFWDAMVG